MSLSDLASAAHRRLRPEDVAQLILALPQGEVRVGNVLPRLRALARRGRGPTSMRVDFDAACDLSRQLRAGRVLFPDVPVPASAHHEAVQPYLAELKVRMQMSGTDFKSHRYDRALRAATGHPQPGHRAYNKRFRYVARLERRLAARRKVAHQRTLARVAKVRLAHRIAPDDLAQDPQSAAFVAYLVSRMGKRSVFTAGRQERAYDEVADALFGELDDRARWGAIALVHPAPEVLARLDDAARGRLLGEWFEVLRDAARVLDELARTGDLLLDVMCVRRGNDSSTWNEAAGAFNKARDGWIGTLHALGRADAEDALCPPKAMRLMAADVMRMHAHERARQAGLRLGRFDWNDVPDAVLEPDTKVWRDLPKPWDVVLGRRRCTRALIAEACARHGVQGKGWLVPRPKSVAATTATPELVHGVQVASPALAEALRRAGVFAGPSKAPEMWPASGE